MSLFDNSFAFTVGEEGSYSSDPQDGGNWSSGVAHEGRLIGSKYGVSAPVLLAWMGPYHAAQVTAQTMRALSQEAAQAIAGAHYWNPVRGDALPAGVGLSAFDDAWNCGVRGAAKRLQAAAGLTGDDLDGSIGPLTLAAIARSDPRALIAALTESQTAFYRSLPTFARYGDGWLARVQRRETAALNELAA